MSVWHAVTDSDGFRWLVKRGPGRRLFRSEAFRRANVARNHLRTARAARRDPGRFANVRTACFFVGHNKSGTSMLGGLLDAHPRIICSDEVDALQYVDAGFDREQIFHLLEACARTELRKGRVTARRLEPYSYLVPGQWQGRAVSPLVVGDSTSGSSTRRLGASPDLLDRARATFGDVEVRLVQVIRNPFDPISVMMVRGRRTFENAIDHYFTAAETLVRLRERAGPALLPVRYEDFVTDPVRQLARVCSFLGASTDAGYLQSCVGIIRREPDRSREMVAWTPEWIEHVERRIARFDFLDGYAYAR